MLHGYRDRVHAGRVLARLLASYAGADTLVLALPRGGVPVAHEIARDLGAPLDLMIVRKLGAPGQPELAVGAIAMGGVRVMNPHIMRDYPAMEIERVARRESAELERRVQAYRGSRPLPEVRGKKVILVDDGLATGATMRAAIAALRTQGPAEIVVAVPVAPSETVTLLQGEADAVICPLVSDTFFSIGAWYDDFSQVSDEEVVELLRGAWAGASSPSVPS